MKPETLAAVAAVILSLAFSYVPGLSDKFETLDGTHKRLVMLACLAVVALAALGLSCANLWDFVTCDKSGILQLVETFIAAAVANQAAYLLTKPAEA
ncbi:MAG: hypothetical protein BWY63_01436 [Chloroflexi bacterium ADurb.Bin360]|nr:MAG: hypothetical protein BWY63_01436 [Chloroflexi bacterium ADurb.Bin360]